MEDKSKKGYVKIDFDLTNKLDRTVYEFFQKMYFGYKKKFVIACARRYLNCNSDQMKELLDDLELNMTQINLDLKDQKIESKKIQNSSNEEEKAHLKSNEVHAQERIAKPVTSKLFKKT
ncbi:hypothetical protein [Fluviispira sanaruensis]|uniref:Uncharacterized protein n=1 Tax=Fluviispira sanaruensis TaxID=2493639 RepID=A0A4P2VRA5_FLUSA|nr:hypothetical protein [Fluviispira sanaruensis]BBH54729.1 hypothetical protein JCM31447_32030 [Fluviispira sanaruensis]